MARRITTWGLRGVRVGEASHPGPPRRHISRPIEGRDVTPRMQLDGAIQVDDDSDVPSHTQEFPAREVQFPRRRRRVPSDDVPVVARGRFAALTESDNESDDEPLIRPTGQRSGQDEVNTIPASSGAVAAQLIRNGGGARNGRLSGSAHVFSTEVDCQETVISAVGDAQDSIPVSDRVGALVEETEAADVQVFAMTECSDTESCRETVQHSSTRIRRRLSLVWDGSQIEHDRDLVGAGGLQEVPDSHDRRVARVSRQMQRERREVHAASQFIRTVAARVGFVDEFGTIPRQLHQQWSVFNVPLMWAAASGDSECHMLQWLEARAERLPLMSVGGHECSGRATVRTAWEVLRSTMQAWGITSREHLAEWIHNQGFRRPRWGAHFSGRAQERILNGAKRSWFGSGLREHRFGCLQRTTGGRKPASSKLCTEVTQVTC